MFQQSDHRALGSMVLHRARPIMIEIRLLSQTMFGFAGSSGQAD
jgi:hypothetical protein